METLNQQKASIDAEIEQLRVQLKETSVRAVITPKSQSTGPAKRRQKSAAEKKAHSEKMKKIWAERKKAQAAKAKPDRKK